MNKSEFAESTISYFGKVPKMAASKMEVTKNGNYQN